MSRPYFLAIIIIHYSRLLRCFFSPVDTPNAPSYVRARARTHTHTHTHTKETWGQKTPTENNNPEEKPEDFEHTNPQTTHPQPNWIPQTTQPIITAPKQPPNPYP